MASFWYTKSFVGLMKADGVFDLDVGTAGLYKILLANTSYSPSKSHQFVGDITPASNEINATNYTRGFGGAGRKALDNKVVNEDTTNFRSVWDNTVDPTWSSLGGAANDTIATAVVFKEVTNDASSPMVLQLTISPAVTTNGGNFTIQFADGATQGIGYIQA